MLLLTPGEPAGVGPELVLRLAAGASAHPLCAVCDPDLLARCAERLRLPVTVRPLSELEMGHIDRHCEGNLPVLPCKMPGREQPGHPDPAHAEYVLGSLERAVELCLRRPADLALVTGPVHKASINAAGFSFSGHTEYLAALCGVSDVVMMLADDSRRVALATTHIPLREVPAALTASRLRRVLATCIRHCRQRLGIDAPSILVLGLNPHAGEDGYLGTEEVEFIRPVLESCAREKVRLTGPAPADTAFRPGALQGVDMVLAMYHDQGLAPLKAMAFGGIVNTTMGLPIVRTSVDHGTALDLAALPAGTPMIKRARIDSLQAAVSEAARQLDTLRKAA